MNSWPYLYAYLLAGGVRSLLTVIDRTGKGCEVGTHMEAVPHVVPREPKSATTEILTMTGSKEGKEIYSTVRTHQFPASAPLATALLTDSVPASLPEEEEDLSVAVTPGTKCTRKMCQVVFVTDAENRIGNGEGTVCTYHPAPVRSRFLVVLANNFSSIDRINSHCSPSSAREARYVSP